MTQQKSYKAKVGSSYSKSFSEGTSFGQLDLNFLIVTKTQLATSGIVIFHIWYCYILLVLIKSDIFNPRLHPTKNYERHFTFVPSSKMVNLLDQ